MTIQIRVPSFGESITESTVAQWHKHDGDWVEKGEVVVTLDTEKSSADLEAGGAGRLRILVAEGTDVPIGAVIGEIDEAAEKVAQTGEGVQTKQVTAPPPEPAPIAERRQMTPAAIAERMRVSVTLAEAGSEDQVSEEPISTFAFPLREQEQSAREGTLAAPGGERAITRKPMSRLRKTIARRLLEARQQTAMLTTFAEVDMSAVQTLRERYHESFLARHGVKLGLMSFFVKAVVEGLRAFPELNASIEGDDIVYHHYYDISIAVSTDRGLVVPVLRDADKKSFAEIEKEIAELARRARENKLALSDLEGGTFTITNGGVFGSLLSTPLLNPPQVGILGMHAIVDRPFVVEGRVEI
ncbi:MAG: dihydrolipoyllysine-residue succinyltransferase, partial [Candidatus Sumerlaeaceae bacterium]|nr:dihydrolipoyllysine-residue succinyltransferase [Candidatus Sumerlaeaceae bacterium]